MKDKCVSCGVDSLYNKEEHIDFRICYIESAGQLCLDCYGKIYNSKPTLQEIKNVTQYESRNSRKSS